MLIPDFRGQIEPLKVVMDERPDILNHNVETVPRLFRAVQPQCRYAWSLAVLRNAKALWPGALTKSGLMVGLGETPDEILATMRDLREIEVDVLTIGQYLQPTKQHLPIEPLLYARGVRDVAGARPGDGLPVGRKRPARAQFLQRRGPGPGAVSNATAGAVAGSTAHPVFLHPRSSA